jgi:hypothetical protein
MLLSPTTWLSYGRHMPSYQNHTDESELTGHWDSVSLFWFCHKNLGLNSHVVHCIKLNTLPVFVVIGLDFTAGCEKDTGTLTGLSFCNPESWFQSLDISWQIELHVHSHHKYGDHVSSALKPLFLEGENSFVKICPGETSSLSFWTQVISALQIITS